MLRGQESIAHRFVALDHALTATRAYWQVRPFTCTALPWPESKLTDQLNALEEAQVASLDADPKALQRFVWQGIGLHHDWRLLHRVGQVPVSESTWSTTPRFQAYIPGRKWAQIVAFTNALPVPRGPLLEWCSGKGHLARVLQRRCATSVRCVERNANLCAEGKRLAKRSRVDVRFERRDVLTAPPSLHDAHAVALHACGHLHRQLLTQGLGQNAAAITVSPCCYHVSIQRDYKPQSKTGSQSDLKLNHWDLLLPVQEMVTAGKRDRRLRRQELRWRLGLDELIRELTGRDEYTSVPSARESVLNTNFESFCRWGLDQLSLEVPPSISWEKYERAGEQRHRVNRRIELVRHAFRRLLELWLVLDQALRLAEGGYRTWVGEFCPKDVTPRNLMVHGERE